MNGASPDRLRQAFTPIMLGALATLWLVVTSLAWWLGNASVAAAALGGILVAGSAICARNLGPAPATRYLTSAALMAIVGLLVLVMAGTRWQIDMHMVFFAALVIGRSLHEMPPCCGCGSPCSSDSGPYPDETGCQRRRVPE